jgi:dienelactone hydrolase
MIYNSTGNDRYVLGGNFREPPYMYNLTSQISPWRRNELIGFRCIRYIDDKLKQQLIQNFDQQKRNYSNLQPVSNEVFQIYKDLLEFERIELNPTDISKTKTEDWIQEIISVDVPYEDAPLKILIFLPLNYKPPYQAIVYFPGIDAHYSNSMEDMNIGSRFDFFLKSGRAVIWPVYYSSYGRGEINRTNLNDWKQTYKNIIIDVHITIDYLQSRNDLDSDKIAFYGVSWGGAVAPYILAIEERIKLGILYLFGVSSVEKYRFKEFDQIDYVPRVNIPMLLLGGRYDPDFTMEQQQAFYDLLGTPKSDTKWMVYETTHWIPRKDVINESLSWLDKYFGPVNK